MKYLPQTNFESIFLRNFVGRRRRRRRIVRLYLFGLFSDDSASEFQLRRSSNRRVEETDLRLSGVRQGGRKGLQKHRHGLICTRNKQIVFLFLFLCHLMLLISYPKIKYTCTQLSYNKQINVTETKSRPPMKCP